MPSCAVASCQPTSKSTKGSSPISFHRFPTEPSLKKQWIIRCCRHDKFNPANCKVCSKHFSSSDYESWTNSYKPKLKKLAIPSLNPPKPFQISNEVEDSQSNFLTPVAAASNSDMNLIPNSISSSFSEHSTSNS